MDGILRVGMAVEFSDKPPQNLWSDEDEADQGWRGSRLVVMKPPDSTTLALSQSRRPLFWERRIGQVIR